MIKTRLLPLALPLALIALVSGCASNLGEPSEDPPAGVTVDTSDVDPQGGGLPGLPPGTIITPPPAVPPPPGGWVLLPIVTKLEVYPLSREPGCVSSGFSSSSPEASSVSYRVRATEPIRTLEVFRNGASLRRIDWPTAADLWAAFPTPSETFDVASPMRTVTFSIVATDIGGRRGTAEIVRKIAPAGDLQLVRTPVVTGPASGAGMRVANFSWMGVHVDTLYVIPIGAGAAPMKTVRTWQSDPWGPASEVSNVALDFTAEQWTSWRAAGSRLQIQSTTPYGPNGCRGGTSPIDTTASFSATSSPPAMPDPGPPPGGGSDPGGPGWLPTNCPWVCNWADHPDKVIVNYERTQTECGATPLLARTRYRMCSLSGATSGAELSVCSGQGDPAGWSSLRTETRADVCVPSTGSTAGNTRVIRKL